MRALLLGAASYFGLVFGTGFLLGMVRVPILVPRVGERVAELIEAPLMLTAIVLASRWVVRRFGKNWTRPGALGVGGCAATIVLVADVAVGMGLRGLTFVEIFANRDPVTGVVYYGLLLAYAVMPMFWWIRQPN